MKKSSISIALASDLHLSPFRSDRRNNALNFPPDADIIVLAGDIAVGVQSIREAIELADRYPTSHVILVAGNHEFYYRNIDGQIEGYRESCAQHDRVHFLENHSIEVLGVKFIGCTLWTDFSILGEPELAMDHAKRMISDFICIQGHSGDYITPQFLIRKFEESYQFLDETLANCNPDKTVVISHFPPGLETRNKNFSLDPLTAYFQANVSYLLEFYEPALWLYGHNHFSNDLKIGRTRLVSNQLGYPAEEGHIPPYDPLKLITLDIEA